MRFSLEPIRVLCCYTFQDMARRATNYVSWIMKVNLYVDRIKDKRNKMNNKNTLQQMCTLLSRY